MAVSSATPRLKRRGELNDPVLWLGTGLYALVYFALGAMRYAAHRNFVDMGIFAQTGASAFGCFCNTVEGSHWAFHFSPILYVAGALMRVWPSPLALVALQAAAGALTIPPVYGVVRRYTDVRAARLAALVVGLYPPLAGVIFNDFHENGLAPAAVEWALWAYDSGRIVSFAIFAALTLAIKEDQAVFVATAGLLAYARFRKTWPRGLLALAAALAGAVVLYKFFYQIQPAAAHAAHWAPSRFYAWTSADVRVLFPGGILQRAGFILLAFIPLLFLPFRTRAGLITVLPLCEVLLSRDSTTFTTGSHYAGAWVGYVFYAFAVALRPMFGRDPKLVYRLLQWCCVLCVLEFAVADPLHPGSLLHAPAGAGAALDRFIQTLPPRIPVATQEEAYTHLASTDPNAAVLPETSAGSISSCYILTDTAYPDSPRLVESAPLVQSLVERGVYRVVRNDGAITLYKKNGACR